MSWNEMSQEFIYVRPEFAREDLETSTRFELADEVELTRAYEMLDAGYDDESFGNEFSV